MSDANRFSFVSSDSSGFVRIAHYQDLMDILGRSSDRLATDTDFPLSVNQCKQLLDLMQDVPDKDWKHYVYVMCMDTMSGSSFVWDLRTGACPQTGSSQTVAHEKVCLSELNKGLVDSFIPKGDCTHISARFLFSLSACQETARDIERFLGVDWEFDSQLEPAQSRWDDTKLRLTARSLGHSVSFRLHGQGIARPYSGHDSTWLAGYEPGKLCRVFDHRCGRKRAGQKKADGTFWQYP